MRRAQSAGCRTLKRASFSQIQPIYIMPSMDLRIVFMGTPGLASHILQAIKENGYNVVAAVTAPDRPAGRGRKIRQSPVKQCALENNIPVLQPENLKAPGFIRALESLQPDIQVVVAFRMLPEAVWALPAKGTFNLHASLLPDYRGAAPINWAIINGEKETGVTTFLLDHQIDTGNILFRKKIPIDKYETAGSLQEKVKIEGAELVLQTIEALAKGTVTPVRQETFTDKPKKLNKAPKIHKDDCRIQWNRPCQKVVNHIHGLSPHPGAFCEVEITKGQYTIMKIFEARPEIARHELNPGTMITDDKTFLHFATTDGFVKILQLQIAGKKRMQTQELLRGMQFNPPAFQNKSDNTTSQSQ